MSVQHWETYYRSGALVSAPLDVEANYTKEVRTAWEQFFASAADGARLLDVGTGNGPLPLIAKETGAEHGKAFDIHGCDLADIDPLANVDNGAELFSGITFHPKTRCEELPFDAESVDAVSGQYIIEYTDIETTLREIHRVLTRGGRGQFILHSSDSVVVRNARESLRQAELAIHEMKMLRKLRRFCVPDDQSPAAMKVTHRKLVEVGEKLAEELRATDNPIFLEYLLRASAQLLQLRPTATKGALLQYLKRFDTDIKNWTRRLEDLESGALSDSAMQALAREASDAGFANVSFEEQHQDGDRLVGWILTLQKPSD